MSKLNKLALQIFMGLALFIGACDNAEARYLEGDPIGLYGGINPYTYAGNNPYSNIDPLGLDFMVVIGRPTSSNPFGHSAIAVTGNGIYSYGTGTPTGSSLLNYLQSQSLYRSSTLYYIPTTPEQDRAALDYLNNQPSKLGPVAGDNCSTRTNNALNRAGFLDPSNPYTTILSSMGIPSAAPFPMTSLPDNSEAIARGTNAISIDIPVYTPIGSPIYQDQILKTFEPKSSRR